VLKVFLFLSLGYFQIWLNILLCHLSNITKLKFFHFFDKIIGKIMGKGFFSSSGNSTNFTFLEKKLPNFCIYKKSENESLADNQCFAACRPEKKASATTDIKAFFGQKGPKWL
jgi:hypothetical protein